jgi:hypothetical protein
MALSFESVEKAYTVFNEVKNIVNLSICEPYFRNENIWCFGWYLTSIQFNIM